MEPASQFNLFATTIPDTFRLIMRSLTGSAAHRAVRITSALLCLLASGAHAESPQPGPTKVGTVTDKLGNRWVLTPSGTLDRGTLPIRKGLSFYPQIDGRSFSFNSSSSRISPSSKGSKPLEQKVPEPPDELKDDARFVFSFPSETGFSWIRYVRHDPERGGMRFIDVMTNTGQQPHSVHIRCDNEMDVPNSDYFQGATTDRGEIVSSESSSLPENTKGVMMHFSQDFSAAQPFFIFGRPREPWAGERRQEGYQLRLEYNGTLEPGKRAIFVHWIGGRGAKEKGKPEKAFEKFISAGRLIDPGVPKDWVPDVINFSKDFFDSPPASPPTRGVPLVMLDLLCKRAGITRDDKDHLILDRDSKLAGEMKTAKLTLSRSAKSLDLPLENVAAISGGAGKGREHRVFLRDGSVLAGRIGMEAARFVSEGLGEVTLNVDSLDELILRTAPEIDGQVEHVAGVTMTARGEVLYLASLPANPLHGRTSGRVIEIPWSDITTIRERSIPDPCFVVSLKDGSRVVCLPGFQDATFRLADGEDWHAATELNGYAASAADIETLLTPEKDGDNKPAGGWCEMIRGTVWAGHAAKGELQIEAAAGLTKFKADELKSIRRPDSAAALPGAGTIFDVELTSGLKLRGRFVSPSLRWQRGGQLVELPWTQVLELGTEGNK
jgi:hypothetical protein